MAADDLYPYAATARVYPLGTDIAGGTSLDFALSVAFGKRSVADRIVRRLSTPRGGLFYAPDYGYSLLDLVGSTVPPGVVEQRVIEQVLAEEEVEDANCSARLVNGSLTVDIYVVLADGPFELVLSASELTFAALLNGVEIFQEST